MFSFAAAVGRSGLGCSVNVLGGVAIGLESRLDMV